jgi:nucleoside-diphosphate-sugar epimerase
MGHRFDRVTFAINHEATVGLVAMAKAAGVASFVLASSCSVYGAAGDEPRNEQGLAQLAGEGSASRV